MGRSSSAHLLLAGRLRLVALALLGLQAVGLAGAAARTDTEAIPSSFTVRIQEQAGVDRRSEPTRVSLPFAAGALKSAADVSLIGAEGERIRAQFEVLARWNDNSIRWLLAHFLADVPADGTVTLTVRRDGGGSSVTGPAMVRTQNDGLLFDTGVIRAQLGPAQRDGFLVLDAAGTPLLSERPALVVYSPTGGQYRSAVPDEVELEENGPLYASVFLAGRMESQEARYDSILRWETRLHFWRGLGQILAEHTVVAVGTAEADVTIIDGVVVDMKAAQGFSSYAFAGRESVHEGALQSDQDVRLQQTCAFWHESGSGEDRTAEPVKYTVLEADFGYEIKQDQAQTLSIGEKSAGWLWAGGRGRSLGVAVRDFWEEGPKALRVGADGSVSVECYAHWRAAPGEARPAREPTPDYSTHPRKSHWFEGKDGDERVRRFLEDTGYAGPVRRGPFRFGEGRAKTTDVLYLFGGQDRRQAELDVLAARRSYLVPVVDSRYLASTRAMPFVFTASRDSQLPVFEKGLADMFENWKRHATRYGFLHFGDDQCGMGYNGTVPSTADDQEYDTTQGLTMQFARTGNTDYLRWANTTARHFIDVDQIHYDGQLHYHGYTASGDYHEESKGCDMSGHPYIAGIVAHYMLTGDRRSLRGVELLAQALSGRGEDAREMALTRDGRSMSRWGICLAAIYDLTRNPEHLAPVKKMVDAINDLSGDVTNELAGQPPFRMWWINHSEMCYHVRELVMRYHAATGDPVTLATLEKALQLYIYELWDSQQNAWRGMFGAPFDFNMPYQNAVPRNSRTGPATEAATSELGMPFAYAASVTGNSDYLVPFLESLDNLGSDFAKRYGNRQFARHQLWVLPFVSMLPANWRAERDSTVQREVFRASLRKEDGLAAWTVRGQAQGRMHGDDIQWTDSPFGEVLRTHRNSYVTFECPQDILRMPGTVSFWVRKDEPEWDRKPWPWYGALRGLLHIGSEARETNALDLMMLETSQYGPTNDLWTRLYDDRAWEMVAIKSESAPWGRDEWHHIAVVWNRYELTVFINGEQVGSEDRFSLPAGGQTTIWLGWRPTNRYGQADYHDLRLFRSALSPERVSRLYESTAR